MFSIVKNVITQYFGLNGSKDEYEKKLEEKLSKLEEDNENTAEVNPPHVSNKKDNVEGRNCFRKTGVITSLESNHGMIDKVYRFDNSALKGVDRLKVGFRVMYIAYKNQSSDHIKVVRIEQIIDETWDDVPVIEKNHTECIDQKSDDPEYFNIHKRSVLGLITHRNENFITVDTDYDKLDIDLDRISMEFLPQLGDRIYLNCNVQTDLSFVDSTGEILEVTSIYPARAKTVKSNITELHESWGVINREYFFTFEVLERSYAPTVGDKVSADVIESDRGNFVWRCTKVIPIEKVAATKIIQETNKSESFLVRDKNGITLGDTLKFRLNNLNDTEKKEITVTNTSDRPHRVVRSFFLIKKSLSQLTLKEPRMSDNFFINPKESRKFCFEAKAQFFGHNTEMFVIKFHGFTIGREIEIDVGDNEAVENNQNFYQNRSQKNGFYADQVWSRKYDIIPGVGTSVKPRFIANRIGDFEVPLRIRKAVLHANNNMEMRENMEELEPSLNEPVSFNNYCPRFDTLLYLEEIEYFQSIRKYDRDRAHFDIQGEFLVLVIENLAEKRPSLMIGDSVRASSPWVDGEDDRCYQGMIHKVLFDRILIKFDRGFHSKYSGEDYRLEFFFSRFGFRKQHYAIRKIPVHLGQEFLFPSKITTQKNLQLAVSLNENFDLNVKDFTKDIKWFNPLLNKVQKEAVKNVLRGEVRPMPYVIFGPPGTGKTMTLVEIILQLSTLVPNCRLLVATPSNSSADLLATRLINSNALLPGDFVRLVSHNLVEKDLIPDRLKAYCATCDIAAEGTTQDNMIVTESGLKLKCQVKHLGRHRVTIGTCVTIGTLMQMSFPKGHFTHVLIDEAGQCLESESLIPMTLLDRFTGQVILTGDPMQLGPVVLNNYAMDKGLETSFLVRMLNRVPYMKDKERFPPTGYDPRLLTKLIYNYRSLPSVLKVFNDLFYDSELISKVDETESQELQVLKSLNDIFPPSETRLQSHGVYFMGIRGENRQDADSPSWYNASEARSIFLFVMKLYKKEIHPKNIGIITPYQKQVRTIRNMFSEADILLPKIGSVEEFQGQERDIILISTVRSRKNLIELDLRHALGFVQSKKRMNVAISRSRSLLMVFGNPHLLRHDTCWEFLIKYCVSNDAYMGCDLPTQFLSEENPL